MRCISLLLLPLAACTPGTRERIEPSFISVAITSGSTGTAEEPQAFNSEPVSYGITVSTSDVNGAAYAFNGDLNLTVRPGKFSEDPIITLSDGTWSGNVSFEDGFGPTRIWATDEGDRDEDSTRVPSFAAGVSEAIYFAYPTISEMQATDDPETNQLANEFAELRVSDREVIVIARDPAGFWAQDIADDVGTGNSVFVYTFNRPDDEYEVGAQLTQLNGINQEYLASTQLSYPTLGVTGAIYDAPAAVELTTCDEAELELLEASRVVVTGGVVPDTFTPESEDYLDYETYGQWPLAYGDCTVYVESGSTAQDFLPTEYVGQTLGSVSGMLKQIYSKWVMVIVDEADIAAGPTPPPQTSQGRPARAARPPESR